jgi:hypothetical protein
MWSKRDAHQRSPLQTGRLAVAHAAHPQMGLHQQHHVVIVNVRVGVVALYNITVVRYGSGWQEF